MLVCEERSDPVSLVDQVLKYHGEDASVDTHKIRQVKIGKLHGPDTIRTKSSTSQENFRTHKGVLVIVEEKLFTGLKRWIHNCYWCIVGIMQFHLIVNPKLFIML